MAGNSFHFHIWLVSIDVPSRRSYHSCIIPSLENGKKPHVANCKMMHTSNLSGEMTKSFRYLYWFECIGIVYLICFPLFRRHLTKGIRVRPWRMLKHPNEVWKNLISSTLANSLSLHTYATLRCGFDRVWSINLYKEEEFLFDGKLTLPHPHRVLHTGLLSFNVFAATLLMALCRH